MQITKINKVTKFLLCSSTAFCFGIVPAVSQAQEQDSDFGSVEEITIESRSFRTLSDDVATKLSAPLSETAGSVTVYDDDFLDDIGVTSIQDAINYVPGVDISGFGLGQFSNIVARGFGVPARNAIRINGAPIGLLAVFDQGAVSRLEYVKGAQAVAYGEVSAGGFVNLALKEASDDERSGEAQLYTDSFGTIRGDVTYGGPLTSDGSIRALVNYSREETQEFYEGGGGNSTAYYLNLAADATEDLTFTTYFLYWETEYQRSHGLPIGEDLTDPLNPIYRVASYQKNVRAAAPSTLGRDEVFFAQGKIDYTINENYSVRAVFSHTSLDRVTEVGEPAGFGYGEFANLTPGSPGFGTASLDVFAEDILVENNYAEIRLSGSQDFGDNAVLNFYVSGEYTKWEREFVGYDLEFTGFDFTFNFLEPNLNNTDPFANKVAFDERFAQDNEVFSISTTASLDLYEKLRLNLGLRYDDRTGRNNTNAAFGDPIEVAENSNISYSGSIVYDVIDEVSVYYAYTNGIEYGVAFGCNGEAIDPEENRSHEIGVKWEPNPNLLVSAAAFDNKSTNRPITIVCPDGTVLGAGQTATGNDNVNPQFGQGLEIEFIGQVTPNLNIAGGVTYLDDGARNTIEVIPTPKWTVSAFARYDFDEGRLEGLGLGAGVRGEFGRPVDQGFTTVNVPLNLADVDGFDSDVDPSREINLGVASGGPELGNFMVIDLAAYYSFTDYVDLTIGVNNVFDKEYYTTIYEAFYNIVRQPPRQAFARLDLSF